MGELSRSPVVTVPFEYLEEPPGVWAEALGRLPEAGMTRIRSWVLWGAHEQMKGVRDFSKSPRLRLEKFLRAAKEAGVSLELSLGFPPGKDAFPAWTHGLSGKAVVPAVLGDSVTEGFSLVEVPSLHHPEFFAGYCAFIEEVMGLIGLYRQPGGPVTRVELDFGVFESDLNLVETSEYAAELADRYPELDVFNSRYNTLFKSLDSAASKQGIRTLQDRRAWLAAYDYKWCRRRILLRLKERFAAIPGVSLNSDLFEPAPAEPPATDKKSWAILLDGVLLEGGGSNRGIYPFVPSGFVHPQPVQAYRLAEYIAEHAGPSQVPVLLSGGDLTALSVDLVVVMAGKYLSAACATALGGVLSDGGQVLFPLETPQYDEEMRGYEWGNARARSTVKVAEHSFSRRACQSGVVWAAEPGLKETDELWGELTQTVSRLLSEGGKAS